MIASADYELLAEQAGVVARPGRAVLELTGSEAAEFLQGQVSNDVEALEPGQGCYATLLDHKGKLRTDMRVLRLAPDRLLVDAEPIGRRPLAHNFEMYSLGRDVKPTRRQRRPRGAVAGRARARTSCWPTRPRARSTPATRPTASCA